MNGTSWLLLMFTLLLLAAGLALLWWAARARRRSGLPAGAGVYSDTGATGDSRIVSGRRDAETVSETANHLWVREMRGSRRRDGSPRPRARAPARLMAARYAPRLM